MTDTEIKEGDQGMWVSWLLSCGRMSIEMLLLALRGGAAIDEAWSYASPVASLTG